MEWHKGKFMVSTDQEKLSLDVICDYLSRSYWAAERPREVIEKSIQNSLNFGLYEGDQQIGFARVVTDQATVYWLADVFILETYRGNGLGKFLMECVTSYADLEGFLGILATRDAHGLYEQYGFRVPGETGKFMWNRDR
ncbi:MAG: GNAT family N-acetyltransferase [Anaerolineaceae bacterium]|nr:GNAT family N-acetyltransferase [Anaerolineaceae bacterium]